MKRILLIATIALLTIGINAQVNTRHVFGTITASDMSVNPVTRSIRGIATPTQVYLRLLIAETAYEIPLVKGSEGQYFAATGMGASLAFYKLVNNLVVERFSINLIFFTPNTDTEKDGMSTALTIGIPIPKIEFPLLNAGIRYDWRSKVAYLQTGVTLEF